MSVSEKSKPSKPSKIPKDLICPITKTLLQDPVTAADGINYSKDALIKVTYSFFTC
jgi:hypothetical protein